MVSPVLRLFVVSSLLMFAGCECVAVPDRDYRCESNDDCDVTERCVEERCVLVDAGQPSVDDAGTPDSGTPDAGFDAGVPVDDAGLICNSWSCIDTFWPEATNPSSGIGVVSTPLPPGVDGGTYGWFGGVLLPDGRVLAVAHTADTFLIFDPVSRSVKRFGEPLPVELLGTGTWRRFYAGGVLHPNGKVYVFPYHAFSMLELDVRDGGQREVGPTLALDDGGFPKYVGGVVDAFGFIWTASEASEQQMPVLRFDPSTGASSLFYLPTGRDDWGGWWGMARLPDDRLLAFPKERDIAKHELSPFILAIAPESSLADAGFSNVENFDITDADSGFPMQGGSLTRTGHVCGTAAGIETRVVCIASDAGVLRATMHQTTIDRWGFNGTFSDGLVWTTPDSSSRMARIDGDGLNSSAAVSSSGRYGFLGLVATPQGMVLIPGAPDSNQFVIVQPGVSFNGIYDKRPLPVLLSPYFNKL